MRISRKPTFRPAALAAVLTSVPILHAQTLQVQTTTDGAGTALQAGWDLVDGGRNSSSISGTVDGVTITVGAESGIAYGRSAGADGNPYLAVDHTDGNLDNLLSGGRFTNAAQDLTLTLSGLSDGDYRITTYHHSPYAGVFDGVFEFDVLLTDANGTAVLVHDDLGNSQGASVTRAGLAAVVTSFAVSGGNDVILAFSPDAGFDTGNGSDQMYLNGFELWRTDDGGGGGGNNFSEWIAGFNVGGQTGLDDDADGDGIDNGVENYFGTAPDAFSQGLIPGAVDTGANTFTFTHPLNDTPADDLTAIYRWSTDLQTFHDDGDPNGAGTTTVAFAQGTPSGGMVTVTATLSGTVIPDKFFVAVEITQNP